MESFHEYMDEYKKQMKRGPVPKAYKGLMEYILALRTHFQKKYPDYSVPGSIYFGYMDMTYFPIVPESFKQRKLKVAIVFFHETCRFEVWLAGINKQVQTEYWKLFNENGWDKYPLVAPAKGVDAIMESILAADPDFSDLKALTQQIEKAALKFIQDIESFLSKHENWR
jgi:Family of unknown function (DUF7000)